MERFDYIQQANQVSPDPREQWLWALRQREVNPSQDLANAEHYLWNAYYANKGPLEAVGGLLTPFGYYLGKKSGLLGGRSEANLEQLRSGLMGAFKGMGL
jgi:hypothetical protein